MRIKQVQSSGKIRNSNKEHSTVLNDGFHPTWQVGEIRSVEEEGFSFRVKNKLIYIQTQFLYLFRKIKKLINF
ncbi:hypothetical protein DU52_11585 [Methanosarcina mazei]|uniref:Uncharacterized protein n=1 Tax=Methanosarcina mazei TaxID=2209 RepID=A0A0F8E971_METMZ|nr:hypothetical protein DU52_11585 [Methanosarcina mazei]KKG37242.1 hypothetical protein DU30_10625 [Methanosarcina mazei]KKG66370.1 hypothetical protein DU67_10470 [Methanosarcina mazei]KKG77183.1 hypothetical protein DU43_05760 [Methanosarcina mazei]